VIVPDNRGTGQSEKADAAIELRTLADDIAHLLDALAIESAHIFGVSMGGMIAQEFALAHPKRLRGLILGCTNCGGPNAVQAEPEVVQLLLPQRGITPHEAIQRTYAAMVTPETLANETAFLDAMAERMLAHATPVFVFRRQMEAIQRFDLCDRLHEITAPTLVITGDRDRLVPQQNSERIAAAIPNARLEVIHGTAHNFFWEAREETARLVTAFLGECDHAMVP
jgi:pimeloyl-ACP methyl ester carboxylesterase